MFVAVEDDAVHSVANERYCQMLEEELTNDRIRLFWQLVFPVFAFVFAIGVFFITNHYLQFIK